MSGRKTPQTLLADFWTDRRMLLLVALAVPIGTGGPFGAEGPIIMTGGALRYDIGRLPVVDRTNEKKVIGCLGRSSILSARERYHREEELRARGFRYPEEVVVQEV